LAAQGHVRWYDLMRIVLSWGLWRRPRAERQASLAAAQATQTNVDRQKEVGLMGQTIAESIWEEGRIKGELAASRRILRQLLEDQFGAVSETVLQRIDSVTDVDRLTAAARHVSRLAKPEDLQL
jgi:hypothetical protein